MHPLTNFFNYLKRIEFSLVLAREHIGDRELTDWYPIWMYELMETDEVRTGAYRRAIEESVSGKVVLELGTGQTAILARYCAEAGAKTVYAIEANKRACDASKAFVKAQGFDNIHVIHGFSDKVEIAEPADVLVHDLVGDIGSSEGMVEFVADVRRRLLKPDAVHIPKRCTTYAVLAEDPRLTVTESVLSYALRRFQRLDPLPFVRCFGFAHESTLSTPSVFEDLLLDREPVLRTSNQITFEVLRDGLLRGVFLHIRLHLSDTQVIDTWESHTSWSMPYVRLVAPVPVKKGDRVRANIESDLSASPRYSLMLRLLADGSETAIGGYSWSGD